MYYGRRQIKSICLKLFQLLGTNKLLLILSSVDHLCSKQRCHLRNSLVRIDTNRAFQEFSEISIAKGLSISQFYRFLHYISIGTIAKVVLRVLDL